MRRQRSDHSLQLWKNRPRSDRSDSSSVPGQEHLPFVLTDPVSEMSQRGVGGLYPFTIAGKRLQMRGEMGRAKKIYRRSQANEAGGRR